MSLGKLVVSLVAESAQFISGTSRAAAAARSSATSIDTSMASIAKGFLASQVVIEATQFAMSSFAKTFETAGQVMDSQQSFGTAPEKFYALQRAVESTGESFEAVPGILNKLNAALQDTESELEGKGALFGAIGLSLDDLKKQDPADALRSIVVALQDLADPAERARMGQELLGKSYAGAANALVGLTAEQDGSKNATILQIEATDALNDKMSAGAAAASDYALSLMGDLAPALSALYDAFTDTGTAGEGMGSTFSGALHVALVILGSGVLTVTAAVITLGDTFVSTAYAIVQAMTGNISGAMSTMEGMAARNVNRFNDLAKSVDNLVNSQERAAEKARASAAAQAAQGEAMKKKAAEQAAAISAARKLEAEEKERKKGIEDKEKEAAAAAKARASAAAAAGKAASNARIQQESSRAKAVAGAILAIENATKRATLTAREYEIAMFKAMNPKTGEMQDFTVALDTRDAAEKAEDLKKRIADLNFEIAAVGRSDEENEYAALAREMDEFGHSTEAAQKALAKLQELQSKRAQNKDSEDAAKRMEELTKYKKSLEEMVDQDSRTVGLSPLAAWAADTRYLLAQKGATQAEIDDIVGRLQQQAEANTLVEERYEKLQDSAREASDVMVQGMDDLILGGKKGGEVFEDMTKKFARMILEAALFRPIAKDLENMFSNMGKGGTSSGGGFMDILGNLGKSIFGGEEGGGGGGIGDFFSNLMGGRETGGSTRRNSLFKVAEGGKPELYEEGGHTYLLTGSNGGQVTPAQSGGGSGGGGGMVFNIQIDASGSEAGVEQKIRTAVEAGVKQAVALVQSKANRGGQFAASMGRA